MLGVAMAAAVPKLYALPASPPSAAVEAALRLKSIAFDRVDLLPMSQLLVGPLRYGGTTVPGMRIDGERLVGSRATMRRLDELVAEPPLLPAPGERSYARVLEAERWGDDVLQVVSRRLLSAAFRRRPGVMQSYVGAARLPLPMGLLRPTMPLTARLLVIRNGACDVETAADLAALPRQLDRIDGLIAQGVIGGEHANAADLQIGSIIRVLMSIVDVRPLIAEHPAAQLTRYFPAMAGEVPAGVLPREWLPAWGMPPAT
jgi:glutathione S-transferase